MKTHEQSKKSEKYLIWWMIYYSNLFLQGLDIMSQMSDNDPFNFDSSPSPNSQNQFHQTQFRKDIDKLWIALSPPSSEGDTELFTIR